MANIKVVSEFPLYDGMTVTFSAPCECSAVDGLTVSYRGENRSFTFRDAHGNDLTGIGNLFSKGALVKVVLDISNSAAFIQNADTNGYLESVARGKSDAVRRSAGTSIKLQDSATAPLYNLRIFGNETGRQSVAVTVTGKNLANIYAYSAKAIAEENGTISKNNEYGTYVVNTHPPASLKVTQSKAEAPNDPTSEWNGYCVVALENKLEVGEVVTVSFDVTVDNDLLSTSIIGLAPNFGDVTTAYIENGKVKCTFPWGGRMDYIEFLQIRNCGKSMTITNIQIEYGETATDYVPAQEVKTVEIDVPVPLYAMKSDGDIRDEIDIARGVFVQRVGVDKPVETPLYSSDRTAVAQLRSYAPETLIYSPLDMEVTYYTPKTALPMKQSVLRKGKLLGVNDEGYVDFVDSSEAGGSGVPAEVAEHLTDTQNPHKVTAKQLGAVTTDELEERLANFEGGTPGEPGYTPVRGVDYWTEEDIAEIKSYVDEAILGGAW